MEPESFTARKNVIKKLKFKLPAACEHSLTACEQQFSQKPYPSLQNHAKVRKAKPTVSQPFEGCKHEKEPPKSKQIKCEHKTQLSPGLEHTEVRSSLGNRVCSMIYGAARFVRNFTAPREGLHWLEVKPRRLGKVYQQPSGSGASSPELFSLPALRDGSRTSGVRRGALVLSPSSVCNNEWCTMSVASQHSYPRCTSPRATHMA